MLKNLDWKWLFSGRLIIAEVIIWFVLKHWIAYNYLVPLMVLFAIIWIVVMSSTGEYNYNADTKNITVDDTGRWSFGSTHSKKDEDGSNDDSSDFGGDGD